MEISHPLNYADNTFLFYATNFEQLGIIFWSVTHAVFGSWTHDLTFYLMLMRGEPAICVRGH